MEEFKTFEEEARMIKSDLSRYYDILGKASADGLTGLEGADCSNDCGLLLTEESIENSSPVRRTNGIIKLDPDVAKDIADSDQRTSQRKCHKSCLDINAHIK